MELIIILKGYKQLNECEDNGVNVMIAKENESHLEKYNRQLLFGLKKIRNIANLENQEERLDQLRRLRGRFNRDIFRSYVHYGLNHVIPNNVWSGFPRDKETPVMFSCASTRMFA